MLTRDSQYVLGIDMGGTKVRMAVVDRKQRIKVSGVEYVTSLDAENPLGDLLARICDFASAYVVQEQLAAVGIGVPGIVDQDGTIVSCPNLAVVEGPDLKRMLQEQLKLPIFIEKDVNLLLFGDYTALNLSGIKNAIGFYIGTGFGCALMINGKIYKGAHGFAGELSHVPLKGHSGDCTCGNSGCLELYGAGRSVVERSAAKGVPVYEFFTHPTTQDEVQDFLEYVIAAMLTTINIVDPELVIIGGGVVDMDGFPWEGLVSSLRSRLRSPLLKDRLEIARSQTRVFGGCLGAAAYSFAYLQDSE